MIPAGNYKKFDTKIYKNEHGCIVHFDFDYDTELELFDIKEFKINNTSFTTEQNVTPNRIGNFRKLIIKYPNNKVFGHLIIKMDDLDDVTFSIEGIIL